MAPVPSGQQGTSRMKPVAVNARRPVPASLVPTQLPSTESGGCLSLSASPKSVIHGVHKHGVAVCAVLLQ